MKHSNPHLLAGKTVKIKKSSTHFQFAEFGGSDFRVEDYWDRVSGKSWMDCTGNPACIIYAMRSAQNKLPFNDEVVYGKIGSYGHLVHISELE